MIYCDEKELPRKNLESLFLSDFDHKKVIFLEGIDSRVGISPLNMRSWIENSLENTKKSLFIYNQSVTDPEILKILEKKKQSGIDVKVCSAAQEESWDSQKNISGSIEPISPAFVYIKKPYPHLKVFLLDDDTLIIGSINLTQNALDNNRETAFLIKDHSKIYSQVKNTFLQDCFH